MDPRELLGDWRFQREISDRRGDTEYTASGEATFEAESDGRIRWSERGTLRWGAESAPFTRTFFLVPDQVAAPLAAHGDAPAGVTAAAAGWRATFEDGRDFHPWTGGEVEHLCGCDLYQGRLDVSSADGGVMACADAPAAASSWLLTWHVNGPEKDYTMVTRYTRAR